MKKTLLFLVSLQLGILANAQTIAYQPIHGDYTQYLYRSQHWNGSENVESFHKTVWSGDTTIGGQVYTRIFHGGVYGGGIREDVANQQRFFINRNDVETNITIGYNLPVGTLLPDSSVYLNAFRTYLDVYPPFFAYNDTLIVTAKDSVLESSGNYSANYRLTDGGSSGEWVLFNTYRGLLEIHGFEYDYSQLCYREDGEQTPPGQQTPWTDMCDLGVNENKEMQIELFPNPAVASITLSGKDLSSIREAVIYDLQGNLIKKLSLSEVNADISLREFKTGVYFLSLNQNERVFRFQKL
ncbi:T9SS type A sorting domain-containing protein [Fluviicola sp.]|uniref:T9SS type A sorting domain-containing protein n=1 Tax=Fluviicola sp. TaxID=1917219 RepID=UPI002622E4D8|nr:T9SS type A sorting domain-containing protein [Fluviicola sp.]